MVLNLTDKLTHQVQDQFYTTQFTNAFNFIPHSYKNLAREIRYIYMK